MIMSGNELKPNTCDSARANGANSSLHSSAVGTPAASSAIASWTLHDVQDPQSAMASTTASQAPK